jgi:hypothetical protein
MGLLGLIKANKIVFCLILVGSLGVAAAGIGCGVYFGVFFNKSKTSSNNSGNSIAGITTSTIQTTTTAFQNSCIIIFTFFINF